jgi:hypothetical protein
MMDSTWLSGIPTSMLLMFAAVELLLIPAQPAAARSATNATTRANMPKGLKDRSMFRARMAACYRIWIR